MPTASNVLFITAKNRAAKLEAKGKQVDFRELLWMEPDSGSTNIRDVESLHWSHGSASSTGIVPMSSFSEFNRDAGGDVWFAMDESRPLVCFAGLCPSCRD